MVARLWSVCAWLYNAESWTETQTECKRESTCDRENCLRFACLRSCMCVCTWAEGLREGTMRVFAEPFASSTSAPDLGGEAAGELVVADGSSNLGYGSSAETKRATEPRSLQSFPMMLQRRCSAAVSLTRQQNFCVWLPRTPSEIWPYSVKLFSCLSEKSLGACGYICWQRLWSQKL